MKNEEFAAAIGKIYMFACACVTLLTACSGSDAELSGGGYAGEDGAMAVSFSTEVADEQTRATTGLIYNLAGLKAMGEGFGVFAYLTDDKSWSVVSESSEFSKFSNFFMQNQQVTWGVQYVDDEDNRTYDWVYSPLKYWPNSNDNATARRISFFAYAPHTATTGGTAGVVNFIRNEDRSPHVIYKIGEANEQVDLLWANCKDATRNGQGLIEVSTGGDPAVTTLTYQKVPLQFKHALSAVNFYVQRVYDEPAYTGKVPSVLLYPTIYISKMELKSTTKDTDGKNMLQTSGRLNLEDGTWSDPGGPNAWTAGDGDDGEVKLTYDERQLNDTIRGTTDDREEYIRDIELDKWKWVLDTKEDVWVDATTITPAELAAEPNRWKSAYGLSEVERNLIKNNVPQMFLPRKVTLIPTLTYSVVVRDDALVLRDDTTTPVTGYMTDTEGHKYSRIVNTVKGNSLTLDLVAGKRYTVLIRVSAQHVSFELVSVVDWDFPMRYTPDVVTDFENEDVGHRLDEE